MASGERKDAEAAETTRLSPPGRDDLGHFLLVLWQARWLLLILVGLGASGAGLTQLIQPPTHTAEVRIAIGHIPPVGQIRDPVELASSLGSLTRVLALAGEKRETPAISDEFLEVTGSVPEGTRLVRLVVRGDGLERVHKLAKDVAQKIVDEDRAPFEQIHKMNADQASGFRDLLADLKTSISEVDASAASPAERKGGDPVASVLLEKEASERWRLLVDTRKLLATIEERNASPLTRPTQVVYGPDVVSRRGPFGFASSVVLGGFLGLLLGLFAVLGREATRPHRQAP